VNNQTTPVPPAPSLPKTFFNRLLGLTFAVAGLALILYLDARLRGSTELPELGRDMSLGLLFVVGLLTGFHCVGMCGALVVSYATKSASAGRVSFSDHVLYGLGKTLSYIAIGALFGLLGQFIAFTAELRGAIGIAAGVFLILFGLGMLNVWPALRNFRIKTPPSLLRFIGTQSRRYGHPFVIGLLNGLMVICGPLQAMYVLAAGTGNALEGARMMLVFGLGTLPVMLGFGALTSVASARLAPKILRLSAFIVVALGAIMLNRGLVLSGTGYDLTTGLAWVSAQLRDHTGLDLATAGPDYQRVETLFTGESGNAGQVVLRKGVPVKWKIDNQAFQSCVTGIVIPKLDLDIPLKKGEQIVEFTPHQEGIVTWSCNMGMTTGSFLVVDEGKGEGNPPAK